MEKQIHEWEHRQFLMMNLVRTDAGFNWQINLPVITRYYQKLLKNILNEKDQYIGRTLYVCGEHSHYAKPSDEAVVKHYFPNTEIVVVPNTKHNIHVENMEAFIAAIREFIK